MLDELLARPVLVGKGTPSAELTEDDGAVAVETTGESLAERSEQNARRYYDDFSDASERERGYGYRQMIDDLEVQVTAP